MTVLIFIGTAILSVSITRAIAGEHMKKLLGEALNAITAKQRSVKKMPIIRKLEMDLIVRSNIRKYISFIDIYLLLCICLVIFIIVFARLDSALDSAAAAAGIALLAGCVPIFMLDMLRKYNAQVVRNKLAEFISVLARWCSVKEDIFYAFEKSLESGIGEPIRTHVRDMLIQVRSGLDPAEAMDILALKADNAHFNDFIINIKQNIKSKGDILKLMTAMEDQFYRMKSEMDKRKISTFKDRAIVYVIMCLTAVIAWYLLQSNPGIREFYVTDSAGKAILTGITAMYVLGVYFAVKLNDFDY